MADATRNTGLYKWVIGVLFSGIVVLASGWALSVNNNIERADTRLDKLEATQLTKEDLHEMKRDINRQFELIYKTLLNNQHVPRKEK